MRSALTASLLAVGVACAAGARTSAALAAAPGTPRTHRLEATAATVAYGYYWSEAAPVLRIASGDIIDVDTLLTNTPAGLEKAGVSEARIQSHAPRLRPITSAWPPIRICSSRRRRLSRRW
jgi:hypothetical protein